jgi:proteasome lid subunit RPN8/RPN11
MMSKKKKKPNRKPVVKKVQQQEQKTSPKSSRSIAKFFVIRKKTNEAKSNKDAQKVSAEKPQSTVPLVVTSKPKAKDQAVPNWIVIEPETLAKIEEHAFSVLDAEVGGMLFGSIENGKTTIVGMVPARTKSVDQISLTFTHEVWELILSEGSQLYPDSAIIGWYHTHPSFGLFLSEYDAFIQRNFFGSNGQLALVIDPIEGSLGWFTSGANDSITKLGVAKTSRGASAKTERESPQLSSSRSHTLTYAQAGFAAAAAAVVFGFVGFGISQMNVPVDLSAQVASDSYFLNKILTKELDYVYTVQKGDTLVSLTNLFYGVGQSTDLISKYNPLLKGALKVGDQLNIYKPKLYIDWEFSPPQPPTPSPSPTETTPAPTPTKTTTKPNPFPSTSN